MGNLVGVVAAVSAGGAGAVFWMWITAIIGSSTAFIEATLAQLYKEKDPLYGGYRGGPAYYMHHYAERRTGKTKKHVCIAVLFAISGLICHDWDQNIQHLYCGIFSQYDHCRNGYQNHRRKNWRNPKCIFKRRCNRITDHLTDPGPADEP